MKTALLITATVGLFMGTAIIAEANPADKKFHPVKHYCVWYEHTGNMMTGESHMCMRKHGHESFTISKTGISMMGINQTQNTHTIMLGEKIININLDNLTYTVVDNPMYEGLSNADPEDLNAQIMGLSD